MPRKRFKSLTELPLHGRPLNGYGRSRIGLHLIGVALFGAIGLLAQAVSAASLTNWQYDPRANQLEIVLKEGTTPKYFLMAQPTRIVLDLPDTEVGDVKLKESYEGAVRQVRVAQFQPGLTRIVLELSPDVALAPDQVTLKSVATPNQAGLKRWILRPVIAQASAHVANTPVEKNASAQETSSQAEPYPPNQPATKPGGERAAAAASELPPGRNTLAATSQVFAPPSVRGPESEFALPSISPPKILTPPLSVEVPPVNSAKAEERSTEKTPTSTSTGKDAASELPATAIGSDVSPVTFEPLPSQVSVPPIPPSPTGTPQRSPEPVQQVAQLPLESTTPLPPVAPPLPNLGVASPPPVQGAFPPSVAPPFSPSEIVIEPSSSSSPVPVNVGLPNKVAVPPVSSVTVQAQDRTPGPQPSVSGRSPARIDSSNLEIPSTLRIRPSESATIQVPALNSPVVNPGRVSVPGMMPQFPASSVMQSSTVNGQLSGALRNPSPPLTNVDVPPMSSVMQSSSESLLRQPAAIQPPPSSVIQAPASSPAAIAFQSPAASSNPSSALVFPPVQSLPAASGSALPAATVPSVPAIAPPSTIEFGQPLPQPGPTSFNSFPQTTTPVISGAGWQPRTVFQSPNPTVLLPAGTLLMVSYPGNEDLKLETEVPRQEVLLLQTEVRDATGNVVFPQGSYVIGQFETDRNGSKFIASAIQVRDRSIPFSAESDAIVGNRELAPSTLAVYSGAGALAGGVVSKFSGLGLLLGGAAGAAANYFTAPKPATLQPGQSFPMKVIRDLQ